MNLIKKIVLFALACTLFGMNLEGMGKRSAGYNNSLYPDAYSSSHFQAESSYEQILELKKSVALISILGNYVTQLLSIYSVATVNEGTVDKLAKARTIFNSIEILLKAHNILSGKDATITKMNALNSAEIYLRLKNILADKENGENAANIVAANGARQGDQKLRNKKFLHYAWLSLNSALSLHCGPEFKLTMSCLIGISEFYRQRLMYAMIANK